MKTKAIVVTLLVAAAASADARFAWPYPRKTLPPDEPEEISHWTVISDSPSLHDTKAELAMFPDGQTRRGEASLRLVTASVACGLWSVVTWSW